MMAQKSPTYMHYDVCTFHFFCTILYNIRWMDGWL